MRWSMVVAGLAAACVVAGEAWGQGEAGGVQGWFSGNVAVQGRQRVGLRFGVIDEVEGENWLVGAIESGAKTAIVGHPSERNAALPGLERSGGGLEHDVGPLRRRQQDAVQRFR